MNSFNHYSLGSVAQWLYEYVAGIRLPPSAGLRARAHRPRARPARVGARDLPLRERTDRSAWRQDGDTFRLDVEIPANVTATVVLPGGERREVGSGRRSFTTVRASERELVRARPRAQL